MAAALLESGDDVDRMRSGSLRLVTTATDVLTLREFDINRMPSADVATAVIELRRLAGWTDRHYHRAASDMEKFGSLEYATIMAIGDWASNAEVQFYQLANALVDLGLDPSEWNG